MDITGRKLLKQLTLELKQEKEIKANKEILSLKKRVRYLGVALIATMLIGALSIGGAPEREIEKVNYNLPPLVCPDPITTSIDTRIYCILT